MFQNFNLNHSLLMKSLAIPNQFQRALLFPFVVKHFHYLPKTALTQCLEYFISIGNVIVHKQNVVPFVVIITIIQLLLRVCVDLFALMSHKLYVFVFKYFWHFVTSHLFRLVLHNNFWCKWELSLFDIIIRMIVCMVTSVRVWVVSRVYIVDLRVTS